MNKFSERFEQLRIEMNLSYQDVANALNIGERAVRYYVSGKRLPTVEGLCILANMFGVSTDFLLGLSDEK
ncbi:transcriptional regulator with XRE-family HTH domain [Paenibacillus sp. RC254]